MLIAIILRLNKGEGGRPDDGNLVLLIENILRRCFECYFPAILYTHAKHGEVVQVPLLLFCTTLL